MPDYDPDQTVMALREGQRVFGRYELRAFAGRGGMGVVWRAWDEKLERDVALKFLPDQVRTDPEAVRDLKRETKRCLALTHEHIVRVYDFVEDAQAAAIAMEFIDGESLAKRKVATPGGCLGAAELAPLAAQLCGALDYAHAKARVVHRDLKPANLLVTRDGELKVTDFGIARSLAETRTRLTSAKAAGTSGTLLYMSPQQLEGDEPAASDDIYALGTTLYELLAGKPPFWRGDAMTLMLQIRERAPAPLATTRANASCDGPPILPEWERTILACLEKDAAKRPRTAGDVAVQLGLGNATAPAADPEPASDETIRVPLPREVEAELRLDRPQGDEAESKPPPSEAPPEPARSEKSKAPRYITLAAAVAVLAAGASYYFSVVAPAQVRQTETARVAAEKKRTADVAAQQQRAQEAGSKLASARGDVGAKETARASAALEKQTVPAPGQPWENTLGMKFVPVPGTDALFGVWDVRVQDFEAFVNETGYDATGGMYSLDATGLPISQGATWKNPGFPQGPTHPVVGVNDADAEAFCAWLTKKERAAGRLAANQSYELPTNDDWSKAAGPSEFPWGDQWPPPHGSGNFLDATAKKKYPNWPIFEGYDDGYADTSPVGSFPANRYGLFDMSGNVCQRTQGGGLRGSSFYATVDRRLFVSSFRGGNETRTFHFGFRVVVAMRGAAIGHAAANTNSIEKEPLARVPTHTIPQPGQPWENTLSMKFVPVPGTDVLFSIWDTRVQDYQAFVSATRREWSEPGFEQGPTHPAVNVSWDDAKAFCAWLTEKEQREGRLGPSQRYRLPQDWEWSVAVGLNESRTGTPQSKDGRIKGIYPWGTQWPPPRGAGNYDTSLNIDDFTNTSAVGSFTANKFGLYDMGGNVWQWCEDFYAGSSGSRVLRGASFNYDNPFYLLSSYRHDYAAAIRIVIIGFRCVVTVGSGLPSAASTQLTTATQRTDQKAAQKKPRVGEAWTIPGLNLTLVPIAPGTFTMGSESGDDDEKPLTRVRLTKDFWLGRTEVTQAQWSGMMGTNPSGFTGDDRPVENVSWTDVIEFCRKLTERERAAERLPEGYAYTLPTEAQWEYACRAGTTGDYAGDLDAMAWYATNSGKQTHAVGTKQANAWGLSDMHGNVWEWCLDWHAFFLPGGSVSDYAGPPSGSNRVYRGGGWWLEAKFCRSADRNGGLPGGRFNFIGFRLALAPSP